MEFSFIYITWHIALCPENVEKCRMIACKKAPLRRTFFTRRQVFSQCLVQRNSIRILAATGGQQVVPLAGGGDVYGIRLRFLRRLVVAVVFHRCTCCSFFRRAAGGSNGGSRRVDDAGCSGGRCCNGSCCRCGGGSGCGFTGVGIFPNAHRIVGRTINATIRCTGRSRQRQQTTQQCTQ